MTKELLAKESDYSMIITTTADKESAKSIARLLVENQLAACVQMFPIESVYVWQGKICEENETALFIKSKAALFSKISAAIKENHTYEVPEIIQIDITDGLPEYLAWIADCTLKQNIDDRHIIFKLEAPFKK